MFCVFVVCGKRYKNQQGLRYHYEHFNHDEEDADMNEDSQQSLPTSVSEPRPKRNKGPGPASPNIYCDFCLGDSGENKKTGTAEKLISCADCGRSGKYPVFVRNCSFSSRISITDCLNG